MNTNISILETVGTPATDFNTTLSTADLNWEPVMEKVGGMDSGVEAPQYRLLSRSDTREPLGIVGHAYTPSQPREFLEAQYEFADFVKGKVTRAGFLKDRSRAFSFVKLDDIVVKPKGSRAVGDVCGVYIYSTDGWDGGTSLKSRLFIERLRCLNGMRSSELRASMWVSHGKGMKESYDSKWKKFLAEVRSTVSEVRGSFIQLIETPMTAKEMTDFAVKLVPDSVPRFEGRREELVTLFSEGAGNVGATRWDAYNAVTEYVTHRQVRRLNEGSFNTLETKRFLGVLEKDTVGPRALELLLN